MARIRFPAAFTGAVNTRFRRPGFWAGRSISRPAPDDPDEAILARVPLTGLENQSIPKTLEKASRTLTVEEVSRLMEAGAESGWPVSAAETWAAFYGIAWLCGIRPDDLVRLEHDGERSRVDLETQTLHFISSKRNVPVHLPLPSWLFPVVEFLVEDAREKERQLLFPFSSRRKGTVTAESITARVKRHYRAAGVEPIVENRRKLWLYGFRKTSVTWWLTHHPGWQKQVNGHSVRVMSRRPTMPSTPR